MPGEASPPLTPSETPSTPPVGVDAVSSTRTAVPGSVEYEQPPRQHPPAARRRRLFALLAVVAVLAYASDQLSKVIALDVLADGQPRPFVGDVIRFKLIGNPGAALSLGAGNTWVMTIIALVVLVAIVYVSKDLGSRAWALALGLLLGSALGNLTDRFVRPPGGGEGHVVDFLDYNGWFIGNIADIWIVGAALLIIALALLGVGVDGRRDKKPAPAGPDVEQPGRPRVTEESREESDD